VRTFAIYCEVPGLEFSESALRETLLALDQMGAYPIPDGELSVALLGEETLQILHGKFLADPEPTDVITFPGDPEEDFAGEICISVDCAVRCGQERGIGLSEELTLYLVHGWLHLAGLGDGTEEEKVTMRAAEERLISFLRGRCLIPDFAVGDQPDGPVEGR
jgi:probable rRNA maturation factor